MSNNEKMNEVMERLENGVKEIFESENYKNYLTTMSKFTSYSFNNCILIALQKPDASRVAGYDAWKTKFGRQVKKGEQGIRIIAPIIKKEKVENPIEGEPEEQFVVSSFRATTVFDISQTEGPELPSLAPDELVGSVAMYEDLFTAIKEISPVPIRFDEISSGAKGYYSYNDGEIVIKNGLSETQTIKTAIHESAHAILHNKDRLKEEGILKDTQTKEVEAESVAYVVCSHLGLDTGDYSFPYVAGWSEGKDVAVLKDSMTTIKDTSEEIINQLDEHLQRIDRFEIYQIDENGRNAGQLFQSFEDVGEQVNIEGYNRVYVGRLDSQSPDDIFARFNQEQPEDFTGHSLSVSDVIIISRDGEEQSYYVDKFGFKEIEDFKVRKETKKYEYNKSKTR